jgi:hypothetical protein
MERSAVRTIFVAFWALAMLGFSQRAGQARFVPSNRLDFLTASLMDPRQWEPAGGLLSRTFPGTRIDWLGRPGGVWTLPGAAADRDLVEHQGRRMPNHQQFTAKTRRDWRSFHLQLDFRFDGGEAAENGWEAAGNSGVYIYGLYEVQLVDTSRFLPPGPLPDAAVRDGMVQIALDGRPTEAPANKCLCGSIYGGGNHSQGNPLAGATTDRAGRPANFCNQSGQWNRLEVFFAPARFRNGRKTHLATVAVLINGRQVHYNGRGKYGIPQPTGSQCRKPDRASGPIAIQDHAGRVSFRNILIDSDWRPPPGWVVSVTDTRRETTLATSSIPAMPREGEKPSG